MPHVASLEEQGEMLGRILRIATAATAASLVSNLPPGTPITGSFPPNGAPAPAPAPSEGPTNSNPAPTVPMPPNPETTSSSTPQGTTSQGRTPGSRLGSELLERLTAISSRVRNPERTPSSPAPAPAPPESEAMSTISRLMREALRASVAAHTPRPSATPETHTNDSPASSVLSTLENARHGNPITEGEPGTFERFLHDLLQDLGAAVLGIDHSGEARSSEATAAPSDAGPSTRASTEPPRGAEEADPAVRARREGDLSCGQLSFFRLYRFERNEESSLIPCVLVGVRSLRADERLMGNEERNEDGQNNTSRFILFVSGGRYHDDHPLLTARPRDAGRDLMFMMELLGTMAAMSNKPQTASASDIARSGLRRVAASELAGLREQGEVTENTSEKCLVCLEDWQPADECRILTCHHAFHAACVDKWLEQSSNSCPLCTSLY